MKKYKMFTAVFCVLLCSMFLTFAQEKAQGTKEKKDAYLNEIYGGFGSFSTVPVFVNLFDAMASLDSGATFEPNKGGVCQLGYNYFLSNHIMLGPYATYEHFVFKEKNDHTDNFNLFTLQMKLGLHFGFNRIKLYNYVSAGVAYMDYEFYDNDLLKTDTDSNLMLMINIVPIGIKAYVTDHIGFYADIGLISTGYLNAGVTYRF